MRNEENEQPGEEVEEPGSLASALVTARKETLVPTPPDQHRGTTYLTQSELAEHTRRSVNAISSYEVGAIVPKKTTFDEIYHVLRDFGTTEKTLRRLTNAYEAAKVAKQARHPASPLTWSPDESAAREGADQAAGDSAERLAPITIEDASSSDQVVTVHDASGADGIAAEPLVVADDGGAVAALADPAGELATEGPRQSAEAPSDAPPAISQPDEQAAAPPTSEMAPGTHEVEPAGGGTADAFDTPYANPAPPLRRDEESPPASPPTTDPDRAAHPPAAAPQAGADGQHPPTPGHLVAPDAPDAPDAGEAAGPLHQQAPFRAPFPITARPRTRLVLLGVLFLSAGLLSVLVVVLFGTGPRGDVLRGQASPTRSAATSQPSARPTNTLPTPQPSASVSPAPNEPMWLLAINGLANGTAQGGYPFVAIDLSNLTASSLPVQAVQPIGNQLETNIQQFAYSPQTHQLAYVLASSQSGEMQMGLWITTLNLVGTGTFTLNGSQPRDLSALCPRCQGALAFSPSGTWLLSTDSEIVGLNVTTGTQQVVLSTPGTLYTDLACSPDGTSLAVVAEVGSEEEIDLLASHDCLPTDPVTVQARLVSSGGPTALAHPVFSLDGTMLAFDLNSGGSTGSLWQVMVAPVAALKRASQPTPISQATQVSGSNCYDSAWVQAPPDASPELVYACATDAGVSLMQADPAANPPTPSPVFPSNQASDDRLYAPIWLASLPAT